MPFEQYCKAIDDETEFLSHEHTLNHFKELWTSNILLPPANAQDEKGMLDLAHQKVEQAVDNWQPPQIPEEKMKALEKLLTKARTELCG